MSNKKEKSFKTSIGGQALIEGVMMKSPDKTAIAVRRPDGEVSTVYKEYKTLKEKNKIFGIPLVRGVAGMIDSMIFGFSCLKYSAEESGMNLEDVEPQSKFEKWLTKIFGEKLFDFIMMIAMVLGVALSLFLFTFLPAYLFDVLSKYVFTPENASWLGYGTATFDFYRSLFIGILKILIFILYMVICTSMKDVRRVFQYHGAEHKSIFCYEAGEELTVENVRKQRRFHPRCGTSFLSLMVLIGVIVGFFIKFDNAFLQAGMRILLLPLITGVGYELLRICGKYDNFIIKIIAAPGLWVQRLTVKEPDDSMIEVAIESIKAVIPENGEDPI